MESAVLAVIALLLGAAIGALATSLIARRRTQAGSESTAQAYVEIAAQNATLTERASARAAQVVAMQARLDSAATETERLRSELAASRESHARVSTELREQREQSVEKLALLQEARDALTAQFKTLANDILEEKSRRFSEQNRGELDLLLKPLGEKLQAFEKKVEDTYLKEASQRLSLQHEVLRLQQTTTQISKEADNLTRALKGESKTRGNWGEVILERILERSGLVKGREYVAQATMAASDDENSGKVRPDFVIHLPNDKHIVIDSKVSLVAYDRYYATEDEIERATALKEHVGAMRRHFSDLYSRRYQSRAEVNTPDFVAMFVPIEPAYHLAAGHDESLCLDAFEKRVVIVTPSTLLAMLSTVATLWQRESQTRNAVEIAVQSGGLYDQFVLVIEALTEVGKKLDDAQKAFQLTEARLKSGRGNLVKRVEDLRKMGAKAKRQLPVGLVEAGEMEDGRG